MGSQRGQNKPLTHSEIIRLPLGFTATSFGYTGQGLKALFRRNPHPVPSAKRTRGRILQYVPIFLRDEQGNILKKDNEPIVRKRRLIWHRIASHEINKA